MTSKKRTRRSTKSTEKPTPSNTTTSTTTSSSPTAPPNPPDEAPKPKRKSPPPPPPSPPPAITNKNETETETETEKKRVPPAPVAVSPPLSKTPFRKFIYVLVLCATLFLAWYVYGMTTLLWALKDEVGWWGMILGGSDAGAGGGPPSAYTPFQSHWNRYTSWYHGWERYAAPWWATPWKEGEEKRGKSWSRLDNRLNALADELGILPRDVASALRPVVPSARFSGLAEGARETGRSEAVKVLLGDDLGGASVGGGDEEGTGEDCKNKRV